MAPSRETTATVNIAGYAFVAITDAAELTARLRESASRQHLLGTILVADEGINLCLAGTHASIDCFMAELRSDTRFMPMPIRRSLGSTPPFARLKVKRRRETITFGQPELQPQVSRAPCVHPATLRQWIEHGHDDAGRPLLLLDTRNREEVRHGSFKDAMTLPIDRFSELPTAIEQRRDDLAGHAVVGFCTGGIRCEKAVLWMQANGVEHALQLDGGILGYFEAVGGFGYEGDCFVFDERIALDASLRERNVAKSVVSVPPQPATGEE